MCTAIAYKTESLYFGRTLDLECSFGEKVIITPENYVFDFSNGETIKKHSSIIGIGITSYNYPLYYDAANGFGLCAAGLNFPKNAIYNKPEINKNNIASYEFIPYILATCKTVDQAIDKIKNINITNRSFSVDFHTSPLHWMIADTDKVITVEPLENKLAVHFNPIGVLTNNPPFNYQLHSLDNYFNLTPFETDGDKYSRGLGAYGLPGDLSSNSRFIRAWFTKSNSVSPREKNGDITQFFHILGSVSQTNGCVRLKDGKLERTVYTSCYDEKNHTYFYTTYCNNQINAVKLLNEDLSSSALIEYSIENTQQINYRN